MISVKQMNGYSTGCTGCRFCSCRLAQCLLQVVPCPQSTGYHLGLDRASQKRPKTCKLKKNLVDWSWVRSLVVSKLFACDI